MEESSPRGRSVSMWAALILIVLAALASGFISYSAFGSAQTTTTTVTSTTSTTTTSYLTTPGNATGVLGIDPAWIYLHDNQSIVTVQGYVLTKTVTFFGPSTSIGEVLGSGFVTTYGGAHYIVTNFHVVDSAENVTATFRNGNAYPVKVVGTDPYSDLAVLSTVGIPSSELHPLSLYPSSSLRVGDPIVAIGNPFGLSGSMTVGIISQLGRTITEPTAGNFSIADAVQFSAPINPGNSGGALIDSQGLIVGITTAIVSGSQGVGFAIPSNTIIRELGSLISKGTYDMHPLLGVSGTDMNYQLARATGAIKANVTYGVLVESVVAGGPAQKAGIRGGTSQATIEGQQYYLGGDVIVSINGTRIVSYDALASYLEEHAVPGNLLQIGIVRGGSYMTVNLTVGVRPPPP